tara:strand:+ start:2903 stop:3376 length:474 start_codon:yes stop_codon:yes gene_type:complete
MKKWKNMQIESKVFYIFLLFSVLFVTVLFLSSCSSLIYKYPPYFDGNKPSITHVLALTSAGDTVKIPINDIKQRSIYNVIGYDFYNPYRYDRYYDIFRNDLYRNYGHYQGAQSSGSKIQYNNISPPSTPTSSGTSGFSGNPVASNPVTSGGGAKKKN